MVSAYDTISPRNYDLPPFWCDHAAFPIPAYSRWLSENETKLIGPIAIRSQLVKYEVLCTKAIAARRSTTSNGLTAN